MHIYIYVHINIEIYIHTYIYTYIYIYDHYSYYYYYYLLLFITIITIYYYYLLLLLFLLLLYIYIHVHTHDVSIPIKFNPTAPLLWHDTLRKRHHPIVASGAPHGRCRWRCWRRLPWNLLTSANGNGSYDLIYIYIIYYIYCEQKLGKSSCGKGLMGFNGV